MVKSKFSHTSSFIVLKYFMYFMYEVFSRVSQLSTLPKVTNTYASLPDNQYYLFKKKKLLLKKIVNSPEKGPKSTICLRQSRNNFLRL